MKQIIIAMLALLPAAGLNAQTSRVQVLQNARNLVVQTADGQSRYYLVTSEQSQKLALKDGRIVINRDAYDVADITGMRLKVLTRFALDEDSTTFNGNYSVDHGLLALRRSFTLGQWNSLVLPVALTGEQVRTAFGADALLATFRGVSAGEEAIVQLETVDLDTDGVVIQAGDYYLIRPTREPDIAEGQTTSVAYGTQRIPGPLYVLPGVSLNAGTKAPDNLALRSADDAVRVRVRGSYVAQDALTSTTGRMFLLGDEGRFDEAVDPQPLEAFRCWLLEVRNTAGLPLRFYVDGISEDLTGTTSGLERLAGGASESPQEAYDLQGRRLPASGLKSGLYIINGKKVFVK